MNQNPGIEAVRTLAHMGYRFTISGGTIKAKYHGPGKPDPDTVRPFIEVMKAHKPEVLNYLEQKLQAPPERILTCDDCPWNQANPWTHYPDLPNWCGWHMDHLLESNPACIGWRRGEIPRLKPKTEPQDDPLKCPTKNNVEERKGKTKGRKLF